MPSCPSSSTFHLKSLFIRNCLITFFLLCHGALLGTNVLYKFGWLNEPKVRKVKFGPFSIWRQFSQNLSDNFFSILS